MPKLVVGPHTYGWGNVVLGLPEDPKQYGPRVLNLEDVKSLVGAFDIAGWEALREPRVFSVYLLDGMSRRQVLVGGSQFPLTVWQRPVEGDVPSPELTAALATIKLQDEVIEKLRAGGDHHPIELELTSPGPEDIIAVPIDDPVVELAAPDTYAGVPLAELVPETAPDFTFPADVQPQPDPPKDPEGA